MRPTSSLSVTNISPQQFVQLVNPPLLIDVRSEFEYVNSHVPTAANLSLPRIFLGAIPIFRRWVWPQWFRDLPKDREIATICLTAHRSPIAATLLTQAGFTQIFNITGGMMEWWQLKLETRTGKKSNPSVLR